MSYEVTCRIIKTPHFSLQVGMLNSNLCKINAFSPLTLAQLLLTLAAVSENKIVKTYTDKLYNK